MILTIDNIAQRYGYLPSQVLAQADTFDLYVLNLVAHWSKRQDNIAKGIKEPAKQLSQDEMLDMVRSVKERKRGNNTQT
jgi:hypothetical protein